ncbi:MAG: hypothetical protein Q9226_004705 [Calogaya cf. arnoldii]
MSNIRLSVEWDKTAVYAGESIDCVITFKNIAQAQIPQRSAGQTSSHNSPRERWKDNTAAHVRQQKPSHSPRYSSSITVGKKHKKALSHDPTWSTVPATSRVRTGKETYNEQHAGRNHRRSVSIVSMGGETVSSETPFRTTSTSKRPTQGHGRAASLQILPGKNLVLNQSPSSTTPNKGSPIHAKAYRQTHNDDGLSPLLTLSRSTSSPMVREGESSRTLCTSDKTMAVPTSDPQNPTISKNAMSSPKPPQAPTALGRSAKGFGDSSSDGLSGSTAQTQFARQASPWGRLPGTVSPTDNDDTSRSSTDLGSFGSNSSDTMASEYVIPEHSRFLRHPISMRQQSQFARCEASQVPETLMMGYGNIVGSFYLDPSLVDASCFDEVKRKAVVGDEGGGGVVRAESMKRQSGLLGSLGWNAIGESLEGLLGRREVSSIKEGANASAAKWMPILSTPQSLLFVDLRLEPGQSQSYSYSFQLPAGIPPSYRGKAVKFSYNIVIGVQRATRSRQRHIVRRIDVPFRVLPSVNGKERMSWI